MTTNDKSSCIICGKKFYPKGTRDKYCSDLCKYTKKCEVCGNEFYGNSVSAKYCSDFCRNTRYTKTCILCGSEFKTGGTSAKFCSKDCRDNFLYDCKCDKCSKDFKAKRPNAKYCSEYCYNNAYTNICTVCNKKFNSRYPDIPYCSDYCRRNRYINRCNTCGKYFKSMSDNAKYCSDECMNKRTVEILCQYCKKPFKIRANSNTKVCSPKCRYLLDKSKNKSKNNGKILKKSNYSDIVVFNVKEIIQKGIEGRNNFGISRNYNVSGFTSSIKTEVQERDSYTCRICGKKNSLEVHHIVKVIHGGSSELDNLITLCISCHRAIDTLDLDYAINKCMKNAEKNLGITYIKNKFTTKEVMELSILELNAIYSKISKLSAKFENEVELEEVLIQLNDTIDKMQDSLE